MVFRLVTWSVMSLALGMGLNYYNTVERPDAAMSAAQKQFDNTDESAKELRRVSFLQNNINVLAGAAWAGITFGTFVGPFVRTVKKIRNPF
jgi:uncharacterized membrane protein SpoIIM required for sporulation